MKKIITLALIGLGLQLGNNAHAQIEVPAPGPVHSDDFSTLPFKKSYISTGFEGLIFSTAILERPGRESGLSTLRFTAFFHLSYLYNYNFNSRTGMMVGLSLKNIGFIDKYDALDSTVKRRLYTLNVPLGFKFGNMGANKFVFIGAEASLALNYKEKGFVKRNDKVKFNEWFSERTPMIMPNFFVGFQNNLGYLKLSYYPTNFMNPDFTDEQGNKPYAGFNVNIIALTMGINIPTKPLFD